jgi:hypothetical protein
MRTRIATILTVLVLVATSLGVIPENGVPAVDLLRPASAVAASVQLEGVTFDAAHLSVSTSETASEVTHNVPAATWESCTQVYSAAVCQWEPTVIDACGGYGACHDRIMWLINCESNGLENPVPHPNPEGGYDRGLLQIHDQTWGDIAWAGGAAQIYWAAPRLGIVWWAC